MSAEIYSAQVSLLVRAIPEIAREEMFALKGGTAINLFVRDLPRLSVDIDLVYLPVAARAESLAAIHDGFARIAGALRKRLDAKVTEQTSREGAKLVVRAGAAQIKIEVSPVLRGTVYAPELRAVRPTVEDRFGYAEMQVVALPDLYAGKIAAALDRQHPRDLFDIHYLYENEGITDDLFKAFLVYLVSHNRPPHELLDPHPLDIDALYSGEFAGMTVEPVPLAALLDIRTKLVADLQQRVRNDAPAAFLRSFFAGNPDWPLLDLPIDASELPAVQWKLRNLNRFRTEQRAKFDAQLAALDALLADR
ncbi:nucleotidyl transferase AbiEii/AbiGii toxin family protein [Sphingomonas sp.]|uniref:nucleotidyl transferase AbiEii/AbiGii toxin family protein n=1 Tax=Sphingomonas sp. TaxID=28214 RepID=UPI0025DE012B|nr:nucleotidyl transferase AbiEii/AbiGii toxin family protein [Sphingomonas sp.]